MINRFRFIRVLFVIMPLAMAPAAHATLSFGTTPSGPLGYTTQDLFSMAADSYNAGLPAWIWSTGGFEFSLPNNYTFESLIVPLNELANVPVTFTLYSGATRPTTALDSVSMMLPGGDNLDTFNFTGHVQLQGGQNYFLIASVPQSTTSGSQLNWYGNTAGASVPFSYGETWLTGTYAGYGFLGWNSTTFSSGPAWQIEVDSPEPAAMALAGLGLLAIGILRRKR
jgi:hypothetical protein